MGKIPKKKAKKALDDLAQDVAKGYEVRRNNSIYIVNTWANRVLRSYVEPERTGIPKGEAIGLSKKKLHAALLMVLYNPFALSLKEIATMSRNSIGLVRLWRTEPLFKKAIQSNRDSFIEKLLNTIDLLIYFLHRKNGEQSRAEIFEKELELLRSKYLGEFVLAGEKDPLNMIGYLCDSIAFFNKDTMPIVVDWLNRRVKSGSGFHDNIGTRITMWNVKNLKMLRKWHIDHLVYTKHFFDFNLARLTIGSKDIAVMSYEERDTMFYNLRKYLFEVLDILAS